MKALPATAELQARLSQPFVEGSFATAQGAVPRISTPQERRWQPVMATDKILAVIILISAAIPALYQAIRLSGVLSMVAGDN